MVNFTDLKFYKSENNGLGGPIDTAAEISTATPHNLFESVPRSELVVGEEYYKCFYVKNTHSTESMENFKIWISSGTPHDITDVDIGFDEQVIPNDAAIGFDGIDDYLNCGNHATLWSKSLTKFAFSFWIYPQLGWDGNSRIIIRHGTGEIHEFLCEIDNAIAGRIEFKIRDSTSTNREARSLDLVLFQWNHVICSYDSTLGSANVRIYVNGVLGSTTANLTEAVNNSSNLHIADSSNDYKGYIKDFRFWDNSAIDTTEAAELYNDDEIEGKTPSYHLSIEERTGSTTKDIVSLTKTATFENGTFWKNNAQSISDVYEEPDINNSKWYAAGEVTPALQKLGPGRTFPIWIRRTVFADSAGTPIVNDSCIFTIEFDTTETGSSGTPGTGGGTGGTPPTSEYKICFVGDWGCEPETNDVIDLIQDQDYDLVVGVGDNAYERPDCWIDRFNPLKNKIISAYGNHEYEESGGINPYKNFFGDSKTYYSHRFQNILFLILDSNDDKSGVDLNAQRTWARDELEKYKNDSRVVWRIAVMHHPWFGSGSKHPANEFDQVQKFHKLFTDYDVNFVYTGHNHNWTRTHQVGYDSGTPSTPNIVDSSSPYSRTGAGLIAIVSGTGGHDSGGGLYDLPNSASFWAFRNNDNNGVHELVASNGGRTLTGKFRDTDNSTYDTFTINA